MVQAVAGSIPAARVAMQNLDDSTLCRSIEVAVALEEERMSQFFRLLRFVLAGLLAVARRRGLPARQNLPVEPVQTRMKQKLEELVQSSEALGVSEFWEQKCFGGDGKKLMRVFLRQVGISVELFGIAIARSGDDWTKQIAMQVIGAWNRLAALPKHAAPGMMHLDPAGEAFQLRLHEVGLLLDELLKERATPWSWSSELPAMTPSPAPRVQRSVTGPDGRPTPVEKRSFRSADGRDVPY